MSDESDGAQTLFFFCKRVRLYLQAVPFLLQDLEVVPVALLVLEKRDFVCL